MIYLDHAATTPMNPQALCTMTIWLKENFGNPSSVYSLGKKAKKAIEEAREKIANTINCLPEEIYFTSGGTESDNWALRSASHYMFYTDYEHSHIITSNIEHPAILRTCEDIRSYGVNSVSVVNVNTKGFVNPKDILKQCPKDSGIIVSIMMANNEIGTIQPIKEISSLLKENNIRAVVHTDAVQAYGHMPIDVKDMGIDMLSASGHKFGGPKGVGFLYINKALSIVPMITGGGQERGLRSGTENVAGIIAIGEAAEAAYSSLEDNMQREKKMRDYLIRHLTKEIDGCFLNGSKTNRSVNNVNIRIQDVDANTFLGLLNEFDIYASAGSACHSNEPSPSHVLKAIGLTDKEAGESIRLTVGPDNDMKQMGLVVEAIKQCADVLRSK